MWTEMIIVMSVLADATILWYLPRGPEEHHQKPQDTNSCHVHQDTRNISA